MRKIILFLFVLSTAFVQAQNTVNTGFTVIAQQSVDGKGFKLSAGKHVPYLTSSELLSTITSTRRHIGQIAYVANGSVIETWQFVGGIADVNFKKVFSGVLSSGSGISTLGTGNGLVKVNDSTYRVDTALIKSVADARGDSIALRDAINLRIQSVSGTAVDNTDPINPIINSSEDFWKLGGNTISDPTTQWMGTNTDADVVIKRNGIEVAQYGTSALALGTTNSGLSNNSISIGINNWAASNSMSIGTFVNTNSSDYCIAIGDTIETNQERSLSLGRSIKNYPMGGIAIGSVIELGNSSQHSTVLGHFFYGGSAGTEFIAIGNSITDPGSRSISLGNSANAGIDQFAIAPNIQSFKATGLGTPTTGNVLVDRNGDGVFTAGSPFMTGTATLDAGTVTVTTGLIKTGWKIYVSVNEPGGTQGFLSAPTSSIVDATSFVINSTSNTETSTVNWWIAP